MARPPLTIALQSVLAARIDGARRPDLLAALADKADTPLASVHSLPRLIPLQRAQLEAVSPELDPDPAAA